MPTRIATKHNLATYFVISALIHFFVGFLLPTNIPTPFGFQNRQVELSWHVSQPLPTNDDSLKNNPTFAEKPDVGLLDNPAKQPSTSNRGDTSQALTKKPEMLSEELLFVETDFGHLAAGSITVRLTIGKDGLVKKAKKTQTTTRPIFEDQVLKHLLKSTWSPAEINGSPVESTITITIDIGG